MNVSDSERIRTVFLENNIEESADEKNADIFVVNTCAIRQASEDKARGFIVNARKNNKGAIIIFTGCVEENVPAKELVKSFPEANIFLPISEISQIPSYLNFTKPTDAYFVPKKNDAVDYFSLSPQPFTSFRAYIPIMTGCDKFCTYCVVPKTRGTEESRPAEDILKEIRDLISKGAKEINLVGQNVNSFGQKSGGRFLSSKQIKDMGFWPELPETHSVTKNIEQYEERNIPSFSRLVEYILHEIKDYFWLKFVSPHPQDFSDELIEVTRNDKRVVRLFHIPLQSGSDKILRLMNRPYNTQKFYDIIKKIRMGIPDIEFTTDMIAGFCDESDQDFKETLEMVRNIGFSNSYTAKYSPRPGTTAISFEDNVEYSTKKAREKALMEVVESSTLQLSEQLLGSRQVVLIEKYQPEKKKFMGRLFNNKTIFLDEYDLKIGEFYECEITSASTWSFKGRVKNEQIFTT